MTEKGLLALNQLAFFSKPMAVFSMVGALGLGIVAADWHPDFLNAVLAIIAALCLAAAGLLAEYTWRDYLRFLLHQFGTSWHADSADLFSRIGRALVSLAGPHVVFGGYTLDCPY